MMSFKEITVFKNKDFNYLLQIAFHHLCINNFILFYLIFSEDFNVFIYKLVENYIYNEEREV